MFPFFVSFVSDAQETSSKKFRTRSCICGGDLSCIGKILLFALLQAKSKSTKAEDVPAIHPISSNITNISSNSRPFEGIWCNPKDNTNKCSVLCSSGNLDGLRPELEREQAKCEGQLDVVIRDCDFSIYWLMVRDTFAGNYSMRTLTLDGCRLSQIAQGAFDQQSTKDIIELKIIDSELKTLNRTVFEGLRSLQYFELSNKEPYSSSVELNNFLQPMADTLVEVSLLQRRKKKQPVDDPLDWLGPSNFYKLKQLNLSSNIFGDFIIAETFAQLTNIRELILEKCAITAIGVGTFDGIIHTLEYLDLSNNNLKMLDSNFLSLTAPQQLKLIIHKNLWICTCKNYELIRFIQDSEEQLVEEPVCDSPKPWQDVGFKQVTLDCEETTIKATASELTTTKELITITTASSTTPTKPTSIITSKSPTELTTTLSRTMDTTETTRAPTPPKEKPTPKTETTATPTATIPITSTTSSNTQNTESTTDSTSSLEYLKCKTQHEGSYETICINEPSANFRIETSSPTSVHAHISESKSALNLLYFLENNDIIHILPDEIPAHMVSVLNISGLSFFHSYLFCLVPIGAQNISPFNCRSHYLEQTNEWLLEDDKAWFVCCNVLVAMLCTFLGIISIYFLLRYRPSFLKDHKQLVRCGSDPKVMLLLPRSNRNSIENQYIYGDFTGDQRPSPKTWDAIENRRTRILNSNDVHPPLEHAPSIPSNNMSDSASTQTTIRAGSLYDRGSSSDYDASMLGIYEEIY